MTIVWKTIPGSQLVVQTEDVRFSIPSIKSVDLLGNYIE